jgi:xanthine dehydrogenase YagS FAD-binding subunit
MKTLKKFTHINAKTVEEASSALRQADAWAIAGGTDLLGVMRFEILPDNLYPQILVNLKTIAPSLNFIKEERGILKIGALTKLEDIAKNPVIQSKWTALAQAAHKTGSPHIREMGTIGGNICQLNRCWYFRLNDNRFFCVRKGGKRCFAMAGENRYHSIFGAVQTCMAVNPSDTAPALVALNARIVTSKRTINAEEFWAVNIPRSTVLDNDEIVTEIQVPAPASGIKSSFVKYALRSSIDFPIVNCAAAIGGGTARICLNAVFNRPYRATKAEESIAGKRINVASAQAAGDAAVTSARALTMNKYKIQMAAGMVKKAILACA